MKRNRRIIAEASMWEVGTRRVFEFPPAEVIKAPGAVITGKLPLDKNPRMIKIYNKENFRKSRKAPSLAHTKSEKREYKISNFGNEVQKLYDNELFTS